MCCPASFRGFSTRIALVAVVVLSAIAAQAKHSTLLNLPDNPLCQPGSICILNTGGTLTGSNSGLSITGSTVVQIGNTQGADLGTLNLTTGALSTGTLQFGGTFSDTGSSLTITQGSATIFTGTFSGPINWTVSGLNAKGTACSTVTECTYTLSGSLTGTWEGGQTVTAATTQLSFKTGKLFTGGTLKLSGGVTSVYVPEPASLGLMGTGLMGIAFAVKRKAHTLAKLGLRRLNLS